LIPTRLDRVAQESGGELRCGLPGAAGAVIERVSTDSRGASPNTLFIALAGRQTDGHRFLREAFRNGAAAALVARDVIASLDLEPEWPLVVVPSPLAALQRLAGWYRRTTIERVLAITGSNGKTIVKDALAALLASRRILASPGSYNSQLGLPLAILSAERPAALAVLEAGVSQPGEMAILAEIAAPDYGILTNIGMAHFASFGSREAIAREKMALFSGISEQGWVLLPAGEPILAEPARGLRCRIHEVGSAPQALSLAPRGLVEDGQLLELSAGGGAAGGAGRATAAGGAGRATAAGGAGWAGAHGGASDDVTAGGGRFEVRVKTRSPDIIADLHAAATAAYLLGVSLEEIAAALDGYLPPPTRMEVWSSPEGIRIINDGHSADPISVHAALRSAALGAPRSGRKILAFAGMRELGEQAEREHAQVGAQAGECGFSHVFLLGDGMLESTARGYRAARPEGSAITVRDHEELRDQLLRLLRPGDTVLFKGPRDAGMARAATTLSGSISQRTLWVDLAAIEGNVARFRRHCGRAKIIAMLKALAYGTELVQLASWMSRLGIQHIGVSSTSEGIDIRKTGANQDIYVFLSDRGDVENLVRHRLTPVVYSPELVDAFAAGLDGTGSTLDVHLKVDTGMHRLGVEPGSAVEVARRIRASGTLRLTGVCTHFASADDPAADAFTRRQIAVFERTLAALRAAGFADLQIHAANTSAAVRFPEAHYDMVRIGLGLYGTYPSAAVQRAMDLQLAVGVTSRIASIREVAAGETIGYNATFTARGKLLVGVIPFGYDDGLPWRLSGTGHVLVEGQPAPIVGRISMDQLQVDVTHVEGVDIGAEVLLYGAHGGHVLRPEKVAEQAGTIPHELLILLGRRVHRIYVEP
jgi:alanine racemase